MAEVVKVPRIREIKPQPGRQEEFLSSPADICIYGGAAGGGKSWALMVDPLRDVKNSRFSATIFRRTYPEITNPGGLWDESQQVYPYAGGVGLVGDLTWRFPSGARIDFSHLQFEKNLQDWDGAQIAELEFDQLEHFTEREFFYLMARNRSTCGVVPRLRATCNPDPDSFLVTGTDGWGSGFISWWIADDGYADLSRAGIIRWFVRVNERLYWADTREELQDRFGEERQPLSCTFIPATVFDNKILLAANPTYLANLENLPLIERSRFLGDRVRGGNWKVKAGAGKVFNRDWFKIATHVPTGGLTCSGWDLAATLRSVKNENPDYTARVKMRKVNGKYYVLDVINERYAAGEVESMMTTVSATDRTTSMTDGSKFILRWETEPGSAGIRETVRMKRNFSGYDADGTSATGDKLSKWKALATAIEHGNVYLCPGPWVDAFIATMHGQPDLDHDDVADAAAIAYNTLVGRSEPHNGNGHKATPNAWLELKRM